MPAEDRSGVDGVLNIDKPPDLTSHDVVAQVRRLTRLSRVGHAGTLDPQATGVLLIGLGRGTKLTPFLQECPKAYRATVQLGVQTDSYDAAGRVVEVRPVGELSPAQVEAALACFRGPIAQIPPMYSALKRHGQRLYTLARQGMDVERQPRRVHIFRLALLERSAETLSLAVECSSGTYIRVLAHDLGASLGCGAHLKALVRTAIGAFPLEQALTLPALAEAVRQGIAHAVGTFAVGETLAIRGPDAALLAMGTARCDAAELAALPPDAAVVTLRRVLSAGGQRRHPADEAP